jgi:broad specificity phosphatase PhoE
MKFLPFWCGLLLALSPVAVAQGQAQQEPPGLKNTVILIIRHAEKPDTGNGLSPVGKQRAKAYINYFKNFEVDSQPLKLDCLFAAADSRESHRPRLTLKPLGQALGLRINDRFKDKQSQELAREIQSQPPGQHILICWHHGEISQLVRALGADPGILLPDAQWPDAAFGWVLQLRYDAEGRLISKETKRILENLMPGDVDRPARPAS